MLIYIKSPFRFILLYFLLSFLGSLTKMWRKNIKLAYYYRDSKIWLIRQSFYSLLNTLFNLHIIAIFHLTRKGISRV